MRKRKRKRKAEERIRGEKEAERNIVEHHASHSQPLSPSSQNLTESNIYKIQLLLIINLPSCPFPSLPLPSQINF